MISRLYRSIEVEKRLRFPASFVEKLSWVRQLFDVSDPHDDTASHRNPSLPLRIFIGSSGELGIVPEVEFTAWTSRLVRSLEREPAPLLAQDRRLAIARFLAESWDSTLYYERNPPTRDKTGAKTTPSRHGEPVASSRFTINLPQGLFDLNLLPEPAAQIVLFRCLNRLEIWTIPKWEAKYPENAAVAAQIVDSEAEPAESTGE